MNLSRIFARLTGFSLPLVLVLVVVQTSSLSKKTASAAPPAGQLEQEAARKITVILHGLMVGRYSNNPRNKRFELGIVKGAEASHSFSLNYYTGGPEGPSRHCESIDIREVRKLVFEVRRGDSPVLRNIEMWHWQPKAILTYEDNPWRDSSLILNMEGDRIYHEVPKRKNLLFLPKKIFKTLFYFHNGSVKTHTPTQPLLAKKPKVCAEDIGRIAEVVMIEIQVNDGEQLVLAEEKEAEVHSNKVLWRRVYDDIRVGAELRILNLGGRHEVYCTEPYNGCPMSSSVETIGLDKFLAEPRRAPQDNCSEFPSTDTDFQLFYQLVFHRNKSDRFALKCPEPCNCYQVKMGDHPALVPPYRCGMVLVRSGEIK